MTDWRQDAINSPMADAVRASVERYATIYEDPFTCTTPEGRAKLVELITDYGNGYKHWLVRFDNGDECYRTVRD